MRPGVSQRVRDVWMLSLWATLVALSIWLLFR
jgi:hypothetical protein